VQPDLRVAVGLSGAGSRGFSDAGPAAPKLLFLAIRNAGIHWRAPVAWNEAMGQFAILFADRFPASAR
jgi:transposase-like protein